MRLRSGSGGGGEWISSRCPLQAHFHLYGDGQTQFSQGFCFPNDTYFPTPVFSHFQLGPIEDLPILQGLELSDPYSGISSLKEMPALDDV